MMTVMIRWQWSWWPLTGWVTSCAAGAVVGVLYALTHLTLSMPLYRWENIGVEKSGCFNQVDTASGGGAGIQTHGLSPERVLLITVPYFPQEGGALCVSDLCTQPVLRSHPLPLLLTLSVDALGHAVFSACQNPVLSPLWKRPQFLDSPGFVSVLPSCSSPWGWGRCFFGTTPLICLPLGSHFCQPSSCSLFAHQPPTGTRTLSLLLCDSMALRGSWGTPLLGCVHGWRQHLAGIIPLPLAMRYMYYCCPHFADEESEMHGG